MFPCKNLQSPHFPTFSRKPDAKLGFLKPLDRIGESFCILKRNIRNDHNLQWRFMSICTRVPLALTALAIPPAYSYYYRTHPHNTIGWE